jgi:hypothetical protein
MHWTDLLKLWTYQFERDPLSKATQAQFTGAGVTQPDAIPDIRQDGSFWGGGGKGAIRLRDTNDFIDLSTVTNRTNRYKEYERLRNVPEIENAITVMADEACVVGNTKVATPFYGLKTIRWLTENKSAERFLVYCWDFDKNDYTLGWAYDPRLVKKEKTVKIKLDDGTHFMCTPDHRVLLRDGSWQQAGNLDWGDELMPFYHVDAPYRLKENQYPRIFTFQHGWKTERNFIDEWRTGGVSAKQEEAYEVCRLIANKVTVRDAAQLVKHDWKTLEAWMHKCGFKLKEIRELGRKAKKRKVLHVYPHDALEVFDLSVEKHENFCGESVIFHNCQRGENKHVCTVAGVSDEVKEELEKILFNRNFLNLDRKIWGLAKNLFIFGDHFTEVIINPENPKEGVYKTLDLPADSMYRIETTKGKLIEFQQSNEGPDYQSLMRVPVTQATDADLKQATAIRFAENQVIHWKIGDDRKMFYPYGVSLIEPARGPAHQLRLMEDAMVVYRLSRAPERRVFYIDVSTLSPSRAEAFIERIKDQFRKKKVASNRGQQGVNAIEERWHPPAIDEDYWLPIRPNSNTRIDTLAGAQNLGEIDDALYFRNKLYTALNFPKNYFASEDPQVTRISLSAQDIKFARMIERLQAHIEDGLVQLCEIHLQLIGIPEEKYDGLQIKLTPPSDWRELSKQEITNNRINNANALKGSMLMSDFDILTTIMQNTDEEAQKIIARMKIQKLEDFKLQVLAANPQLLGIGVPASEGETEMGAMPGGPNPMLGPEGGMPGGGPPGGGAPPMPGMQPEGGPPMMSQEGQPETPEPGASQGAPLPDADPEDIKKYDLEIQNYAKELDAEEIDYSER